MSTPVAEPQALAVDGGHERVSNSGAHQVEQVVAVVLCDGLDRWSQEQADAVAAKVWKDKVWLR